MITKHQGRSQRAQDLPQAHEWPEKLTVTQAHKFLGVSPAKMTKLLNSKVISFQKNPIDMRQKLIKRSDLEALLNEFSRA